MTAPIQLRGLTWDHRRGYGPLDAMSEVLAESGVRVSWDRQSLEGFESAPIKELSERYDLLVVDHPGIGEAVAEGALVPADELFTADELAGWRDQCVGETWESYRYASRQWALPLDVATQAAVVRRDLLEGPVPSTWAGVLELATRQPVALCLGGPHALLMLLALCAAEGAPVRSGEASPFDGPTTERCLTLLRELWDRSHRPAAPVNPIGMHDLMSTGSDVVLCPLSYTYASYARPDSADRAPLSWAEAPAISEGGCPGSVLGGTGLAVTTSVRSRPAAQHVARGLMSLRTQTEVVAREGGQPAARAAWDDPAIDTAWGGHYAATRRSVDEAYVRPRHPGWIGFQRDGSALVRAALEHHESPVDVVTRLNELYDEQVIWNQPGGDR